MRLLDTYTYSITVKGSYEPFFYNYAYLRTNPYPISVIAPYCEVADDGDGAYLRSMDPEAEEVPFTVEVLTETIFDVHFERARGEVQGAYPAVNRSFAQYVRQRHLQVRYLDREDDMGLPGLRKAKLSYYPDYLQVNYCAVETRAPR